MENLKKAIDYSLFVLMIVGIAWLCYASAVHTIEYWDKPETVGSKIKDLWKPVVLILAVGFASIFRK